MFVTRHRKTALLGAVVAAGTIAGCGSSSTGDKSSSGSSSGSSAKVDVAAANKILAPYTGKPSAFPVDEPLKKKPAAGSDFAYLQCVTPICGLFSTILPGAAKTMGVKLSVTKAGASADSLQGAMSTIIAKKPKAVILPAVEPDTINNQLKTLATDKIPTVSNGIMHHEKYGIEAAMFNTKTAETAGEILAAYAAKNKGAKANVVFYTTPELSFGPVIKSSFTTKLGELCSACKVRQVAVPVSTIGNAAPSRVVSDLQANPKTNLAIFSTLEAAVGLPAALRTAGLKTDVVGFGPNPANVQDIKSGGLKGGVGLDLPVMLWTQVDAAARLATGQPLTAGEKKGIPPLQFIESKDITFDPSKGYTGYPDFPKRFAKLWSGMAA